MKKIYLIASFALLTATSFAQRSFDFSLTLNTPVNGSTQPMNTSQAIDFDLQHSGDALVAGDSIVLYYLNVNTSTIYDLTGVQGQASLLVLDATYAGAISMGQPVSSSLFGVTTFNTAQAGFANGNVIALVSEVRPVNTAPGTDTNPANDFGSWTLGATSSIDQLSVINLMAFPVPAVDILTVTAEEEIASISVFNMDGKVIASAEGNKVDVSSLNSGVYFYQATSVSGITATSKFIKK